MAGNTQVKIDDSKFRRDTRKLDRRVQQSGKDVLRTQARLLGKTLINFTPPIGVTKKAAGNANAAASSKMAGSSAAVPISARKQGEKAVSKDLYRIFVVREQGYVHFLMDTFGGRNVKQWLSNKSGKTYLVEYNYVTDSITRMRQFHRSNLTKRGRVTMAGQYDKGVGRWRAADSMVVPEREFKNYLRQKMRSVGKGKAGWNPGYSAVGGKSPAWITRHNAQGSFINGLGRKHQPSFTFINRSRWAASRPTEAQRVVRTSLSIRRRAIVSAMRIQMRLAARQSGFKA